MRSLFKWFKWTALVVCYLASLRIVMPKIFNIELGPAPLTTSMIVMLMSLCLYITFSILQRSERKPSVLSSPQKDDLLPPT